MPGIFEASCGCGYSHTCSAYHLRLHLDSGEDLVVPHPLETGTLRQHGYSWDSAVRKKRLFLLHPYICQDCGEINEIRRHADSFGDGCWLSSTYGCVFPLSAFAICFLAPKLIPSVSTTWPYGVCGLIVYLFVYDRISTSKQRHLHLDILNTEKCSKCSGKRIVRFNCDVVFPCPMCGAKSIQYKLTAIS